MNRLTTLFLRRQSPKVQAPLPTELRVLSPAEQARVAGGLPHIGGLNFTTPPAEPKSAL